MNKKATVMSVSDKYSMHCAPYVKLLIFTAQSNTYTRINNANYTWHFHHIASSYTCFVSLSTWQWHWHGTRLNSHDVSLQCQNGKHSGKKWRQAKKSWNWKKVLITKNNQNHKRCAGAGLWGVSSKFLLTLVRSGFYGISSDFFDMSFLWCNWIFVNG